MEVADTVRKATPDHLPQLSIALSRAFFDDPLMAWAIPDPGPATAAGARVLRPVHQGVPAPRPDLHHHRRRGQGRAVGTAWSGPGQRPGRPGAGPADHRAGRTQRPRFLGVNKLFDDHHPPGSYWYLQFLGVAPAWQGQGIGSALLAPVLARCDREGMRAYLDATSQRNRRLYERHGFAAEGPFAPPGGPPCGRCGAIQPRSGSDPGLREAWALGRWLGWVLACARSQRVAARCEGRIALAPGPGAGPTARSGARASGSQAQHLQGHASLAVAELDQGPSPPALR
jgi:GNAT superfamily N-acetyltransferase